MTMRAVEPFSVKWGAGFLALWAGLAAAAEPDALAPQETIGRLGNHTVSAEEVRGSLQGLNETERHAAASDPAALSQLVRSLLVQRQILAEATAEKWEAQAKVVAHLARVRDGAIVDTYLREKCAPPTSYPAEAELAAAYEDRRAGLAVPRSFRLAQIFIAAPAGSESKAVKEKLARVKAALAKPGADFGSLATANSEDVQSAARGGEIGWITEDQIQPEIRKLLPNLALHVVSSPVRLDDGWHVLKVLDARETFTPTLEQVRQQLVQQLRNERTQLNTRAYFSSLLQNNPISINELALSRVPGTTSASSFR